MSDRERSPFANVTLAEIRLRGQKPNYRVQGNWLARRWARPSAIYGTWLAIRLGVPAHAVTVAAGIAWLFEAFFLAQGSPGTFCLGVAFGYLGFWLDHVDGQVARVSRGESVDGIFLDFWMHTAHACVRGYGLGWGLFAVTGEPCAILAGMATSFGWVMIGHTNDAAYKAIFAELNKYAERGAVLSLRRQERQPESPAGAGRNRLPRLAAWLVVKLQEPHSVLMMLTPVGVVYVLMPRAGLVAWHGLLWFWAVSGPFVALVRLRRMVVRGVVTNSFATWFESPGDDDQPVNDEAARTVKPRE